MSTTNSTEDIIGALYDMVQDARSMPLAADKCIVERDKVLDMLDEIIAQLPGEIKQSRAIVESRNELISQARREAENIVRQAQERAGELIMQEEITKQATKLSEELIAQAQDRVAQIKKAGNDYLDDALRRTEETIAQSLRDVQDTRMKFKAVIEPQEQPKAMPDVDM